MTRLAILDIDGTLVDSNYQHAIAWSRAFRELDMMLPIWRIHRHIGMGGDKLVEALTDEAFEREHGDAPSESEHGLYAELIEEVALIDGATDLIARLREDGIRVVLASSAPGDEVEHYLGLLGGPDAVDAWTAADDVDETKPEPELVETALGDADPAQAVMVGDTVWDARAAARAEVGFVGVLTGGFSSNELVEAGAAVVHPSVAELVSSREPRVFGPA